MTSRKLSVEIKASYLSQLKKQKRPHVGMSLLFFSFLTIIILALYLFLYQNGSVDNYSVIPFIVIIIAAFSFIVYKLSVRKIDKDIRNQSFRKEKVQIKEFLELTDVEPGSGMLYIPILGDTFTKLWGQKMKKTDRFFIISEDNIKYEIDFDEFKHLKGQNGFYFVYGKNSGVRVGVEL